MSATAQPTPPAPPAKPTTGYDVARPHGKCSITGNAIAPGEKFFAALRETPEGFERLDVTTDALPLLDRAGVIAHWQAVMPRHEEKRKLLVDDTTLCDLFERLGTVEEPAKIQFRFVLGLILMRKRLLVYESSRAADKGEHWSVRFRGKQVMMDLINPHLTEDQIGEVTQQMSQVLNDVV